MQGDNDTIHRRHIAAPRRALLALAALALLPLPAGATAGAPPPGTAARAGAGPAAPVFEPCRIEHPTRLAAFAAECTRLRVPEDPARPAGRQIELFVARIPAVNRRKTPDPLVLIAGGPGMGASQMYPQVASAFARIGRERDILLIDQRGTGRSNPLHCEFDPNVDIDGSVEESTTLARECLATLSKSADLRQYTTSVAVADLERVRAALGHAQINLYGVSYGSRVAQHYLRRHPERVRSLILDGVVPVDLVLGPDIALDAEQALDRILGRCAADAACRKAFGDPRVAYRELRARLAAAPVAVSLPHPVSAERRELRFGARHLAVVLRLQSYSATTASMLPLALREALVAQNYVPLATLFLLSLEGLGESLAGGMHNSVVCSEDAPLIDPARIDRAALERTYLGADQLDAIVAMCGFWPRGPVDPDFRAPLVSNVPTLLLSGSDDPVTPPAYGARAAKGFANSRHLVLPGQGHGQVAATCMNRVLARFVADLAPATLDAQCLDRVRPAPFFTGLGGPAP